MKRLIVLAILISLITVSCSRSVTMNQAASRNGRSYRSVR